MSARRQPLSTGSEWTFDLIRQYDKEIARIAERYALDTYPNQIEVITAEQMMDAYASVGMPVNYHHWSFGKHFLATEKGYRRGQMGLAYEIVINSDPCIAYLQEEVVKGCRKVAKTFKYKDPVKAERGDGQSVVASAHRISKGGL